MEKMFVMTLLLELASDGVIRAKEKELDFSLSQMWSFHHSTIFLEKFLSDRQREEWIGDLEEVLYRMYELEYPKWRLHLETLRRTYYLVLSTLKMKVNSFSYKRKTSE
jgi:hypothetical protein